MEAPSRTLVVVSWGWRAGWEQPLREACLSASSLFPCLLPFLPCLCVCICVNVCACACRSVGASLSLSLALCASVSLTLSAPVGRGEEWSSNWFPLSFLYVSFPASVSDFTPHLQPVPSRVSHFHDLAGKRMDDRTS